MKTKEIRNHKACERKKHKVNTHFVYFICFTLFFVSFTLPSHGIINKQPCVNNRKCVVFNLNQTKQGMKDACSFALN